MKYIISLTLLLAAELHAQDIDIKRKKVKVDKATVLEYDGYGSAFKGGVELEYTSPKGKPLFDLRLVSLDFINPILPTLYWQELTFQHSGNIARFRLDGPYYGRKKSTELLLEATDNKLIEFDKSIQERAHWILENKDESKSILEDSTKISKAKNSISKRLKFNIDRNRETPVNLKKLRFSPEKTDKRYYLAGKYAIYQDEIEIGRVEIERGDGPTNNDELRYSFFKKLDRPFVLLGEELQYLIACSFEVDVDGQNINNKIITYEDGARHTYNGPNEVKINNLEAAHFPISRFLVENGYL